MNKKLRGGSFIAAGLVTCAAFGFAAFNPSVVRDGKKSFDSNNGKGSIAANASVNVLANESDIDSMFTYAANGNSLNLKGNSVVIKKTTTEGSDCANVFLDANHDGVADNNRPFMFKGTDGEMTADLPVTTDITGWGNSSNTDVPDGDVTIYMEGGQIRDLYGVNACGKTLNGKVGVYISGGKITEDVTAAYGITAPVVECKVTGGEIGYNFNGVVGANSCTNVGEVNFEITGNKCITGNSGISYDSTRAKATYYGSVKGDVNIKIGAKEGENVFGTYGGFCGVNHTNVEGDVNCEYVGDAISDNFVNMISNKSVVSGDLKVNWKKGNVSSTNRSYPQHWGLVSDGSKVRNVIVRAADNANLKTESYITLYKSTADNIDIDLSNATTYYGNTYDYYMLSNYNCTINKSGIIRFNDPYGRKTCYLFGDYEIKKDMDITNMHVYGANANITVDKDVTVKITKNDIDTGSIGTEGNFVNNGRIDLEGSFAGVDYAGLTNNGIVNVDENMQFRLKGTLVNNNKISVGNNFNASGSKIINNGDLIINGRTSLSYNKGAETDVIENNKYAYLGFGGRSSMNGLSLVNKGEINLGMESSDKYGLEVTYWNGGEKLGKIINYGEIYGTSGISLGGTSIFDNYGEFDLLNSNGNNNGLSIMSEGYLINREGATFKFKSNIYNLGAIYNYGNCEQKGEGEQVGTIYCAKKVNFELSDQKLLTSTRNHIFFPVTLTYPGMVAEATMDAVESGIEGDENIYAEYGKDINVEVTKMAEGYTFADVESVAFVGSEDTFAATGDNSFKATMPANKSEIAINVKPAEGKQITLDTTEINVAPLTVGVNAGTVYDLTQIKINDDGQTGTVKYAQSNSNPLPEGLKIVDGKIVGTPEKAYLDGFDAKVVITGKNLTRATVSVKFEKINKGTPKFVTPKPFGYEGDTLGKVKINQLNLGSYSWKEDLDAVLDSAYNEETGYTLYFYPNDADNYNWSLIEAGEWDAANVRLEINVKIDIRKKGTPEKTPVVAPLVYEFSANANATIADVELPKIDEGVFAFVDSADTKLETGTYEVIFTPNDVETIEWLLSTEALEHEAKINEDGSISYKATVTVAKEEAKDVKEEQNIDDNKKEITKPAKREGYSEEAKSDISYGPAVGTKLTLKNYIYKVTKVGTKDSKVIGEVSVVGYKKKTVKKVNVASVVKIDGVTYNVTAIGNKAFKNKKVTKVTIGKNVKTIGANAFAGNKKLKKVTVKSNVISKIGKKAFFRKGGKKLVIKVPKKLKKKYKKLLKKAKTNKYIVK